MISETKNVSLRDDLLNDAPVGIFVTHGHNLVIEYANKSAALLLEAKTQKLSGMSVHDLLPEVFSQAVADEIHTACFLNCRPFIIRQQQLDLFIDGKINVAWFDITVKPITNDTANTERVVLYFVDVSSTVQSTRLVALNDASELVKTNQLLVDKNEELHNTQSVLQQLIDSSIELIAVVDRDLKFLVINTAFEKFVQKSRADLVGKHIFEAYQGAKGSKQVELLQKALAGERVHLKANPSISRPHDVWFDTHLVPLEINGKVEGVIALSRDISAIIRSELSLVKVNNQLQEAQRLAKLGSWEWDVNTDTVIWSEEMYRIYGYEDRFPVDFSKATERMSREDAERSNKRTQQHIQSAIDNFNKTGELTFEISSVEFPIKLPDGTKKLLRGSGKLELNSDGKLQRMVGAIQDVSEIREVEKRLQLVIDELGQKNKDLESFNYVASHDLQEPLRKIQTFTDRIRNGSLTQEVKDDYLMRIGNAAKRMSDLIQSMLTLGRISRPEEQFVEVDLNSIVDYCKSDFELVMKERNAVIESEYLPVIHASDFQMRQLFINLISNAFKFSKDAPVVRIGCQKVLRSRNTDDDRDIKPFWCLTFADNGIGFDAKYKEQIFELFQRLHSRQEFSGTGIGLSIVKRIVERHNGFIEADSELGKGATFKIFLQAIEDHVS
jgi:PAS domain S-box-containing protein